MQKNSIEQLSKAVDSLFRKKKKEKSGFLDKKEVTSIINAALSEINNEKKLIESLINYTKDFIAESDRKREELVKQIDILKEMSVSGGKK